MSWSRWTHCWFPSCPANSTQKHLDFGGCEFRLLEHWNSNIAIAKKNVGLHRGWKLSRESPVDIIVISHYYYYYLLSLLLSAFAKIVLILWNGILKCFMIQCSKLFWWQFWRYCFSKLKFWLLRLVHLSVRIDFCWLSAEKPVITTCRFAPTNMASEFFDRLKKGCMFWFQKFMRMAWHG